MSLHDFACAVGAIVLPGDADLFRAITGWLLIASIVWITLARADVPLVLAAALGAAIGWLAPRSSAQQP